MAKTNFVQKAQNKVSDWYKKTESIRNTRMNMLRHYANGYYDGGEHRPLKQPLNLIDRGVQIIAPFLVNNNPRPIISPRYGLSNGNVRSFSLTMELALTHLFGEIKLSQKTLRPVVIDSLFGMGITKTGTMSKHRVEIEGDTYDVGQPYCDRVDFNDYICDITARSWEEVKLEGNKYRLPLDFVIDSGLFKNYDSLVPHDYTKQSTDPKYIEAQGQIIEEEELHRSVELIDLYLPEEDVVITIPTEGRGGKILRTVKYDGPEGGPYDKLFYKYFPNSIIPIPPVYIWLDLNKIANEIASKMAYNTTREKTLAVYDKNDNEDAEVFKNAKHGDWVGVTNPQAVSDITFGGFDAKSMDFLQYLEQQYAISYSNLYGIGGKGAQADTLGQEQMLQTNATRSLDDMIDQFHNFTRNVVKKLAWYVWTDPMIQVPMVKRIHGFDVPVLYSDETKEGDFLDYTFDIDVYSMSRQSPDMQYQKLMQLVQGVVLPLAPLAAQQGCIPDVTALTKQFAKYLGVNNVEDWWRTVVPQNGSPNPYEPTQGIASPPKSNEGQGDDRLGANLASKMANSNAQQASSRGGQSSPPQK